MIFEKTIEVRWADVDLNKHVRHSAYYDYAAFVRFRFFADNGFGTEKLEACNLGPIVFKESCHFIKEIGVQDTIRVNILKGDVSENGSKWTLHNEIFNQQDEKIAHITGIGAWIDTKQRKVTTPPIELAKALHDLPMGQEYVYQKKK